MTVDGEGSVCVGDTGNHRISRSTPPQKNTPKKNNTKTQNRKQKKEKAGSPRFPLPRCWRLIGLPLRDMTWSFTLDSPTRPRPASYIGRHPNPVISIVHFY